MSEHVERLREQFRSGQAQAQQTRLIAVLGAGIVVLGAVGGLIWSQLEGSSRRAVVVQASNPAAPATAQDTRSADERAEAFSNAGMKVIAGGDVASAADQVERYNTAMGKLRACSGAMTRDAIEAAERAYQSRNGKAFAHWDAIMNRPWDYNPDSQGEVLVGAMTGQLQSAAAGRAVGFAAMMAGSEEELTPNDCAKLRTDLRNGTYDLDPPPG